MTLAAGLLSHRERFASVGSTNDVVRDWLVAGTPEICLAVADEQTAGRGRAERTWVAPPGTALLLSLGFRPTWLPPDRVWQLPALVGLAMARAGEAAAGLPVGTIRLKWPNDLVVDAAAAGADGAAVRKLAGVLGESAGLGTTEPQVVVGIGTNVDWAASSFPADLAATMTSLRELGDGLGTGESGPGEIRNESVLEGFLDELGSAVEELRAGAFDAADWQARQITTGRRVALQRPDGELDLVDAVGVDPASGALLVAGEPRPRAVFSGEIRHLRLGGDRAMDDTSTLDVAGHEFALDVGARV